MRTKVDSWDTGSYVGNALPIERMLLRRVLGQFLRLVTSSSLRRCKVICEANYSHSFNS